MLLIEFFQGHSSRVRHSIVELRPAMLQIPTTRACTTAASNKFSQVRACRESGPVCALGTEICSAAVVQKKRSAWQTIFVPNPHSGASCMHYSCRVKRGHEKQFLKITENSRQAKFAKTNLFGVPKLGPLWSKMTEIALVRTARKWPNLQDPVIFGQI